MINDQIQYHRMIMGGMTYCQGWGPNRKLVQTLWANLMSVQADVGLCQIISRSGYAQRAGSVASVCGSLEKYICGGTWRWGVGKASRH
ncbi:hypothetical protein HPP92_020104 [Vanilla planifolia]|uniref:Uncharacterized protein n=1 Tax=Vanilla planifolia TaxID=51239 RepID=A0A835UMF2_VANPL|nr:hypothetical protein HPP92_020104 [Vanilla planifolia]